MTRSAAPHGGHGAGGCAEAGEPLQERGTGAVRGANLHVRLPVERLRSCHFAYFMEYGLKAKARRAAAFDAPQIGTFLHYLLEHVTKDVLDWGGFAASGRGGPPRLGAALY